VASPLCASDARRLVVIRTPRACISTRAPHPADPLFRRMPGRSGAARSGFGRWVGDWHVHTALRLMVPVELRDSVGSGAAPLARAMLRRYLWHKTAPPQGSNVVGLDRSDQPGANPGAAELTPLQTASSLTGGERGLRRRTDDSLARKACEASLAGSLSGEFLVYQPRDQGGEDPVIFPRTHQDVARFEPSLSARRCRGFHPVHIRPALSTPLPQLRCTSRWTRTASSPPVGGLANRSRSSRSPRCCPSFDDAGAQRHRGSPAVSAPALADDGVRSRCRRRTRLQADRLALPLGRNNARRRPPASRARLGPRMTPLSASSRFECPARHVGLDSPGDDVDARPLAWRDEG